MTGSLLVSIICSLVVTAAIDVPSTARSQKAIAQVRPALMDRLEAKKLEYGAPIFIRIFKKSKELELWVRNGDRFDLFKTYDICTFSGRLGPKLGTGDRQSPEGYYFVKPAQMNPASRFHLSFNLGYPNAYDRYHGRTGSALMVHGNCVSIGCYAMTNQRIEEIYAMADAALRNGQSFFRVHVFPFRMTDENLKKHKRSKWADFWKNLQEGYEQFERTGLPPDVTVEDGRYVFEDKE